jgi:Ni,Fe-hydrogenase I large subunit
LEGINRIETNSYLIVLVTNARFSTTLWRGLEKRTHELDNKEQIDDKETQSYNQEGDF